MNRGNLQKQKILIVDDSEMNRSILADILGVEYEILEAEDGVQAVAMLQKYAIDISAVLLDIIMPNMDGFEVLRVMRQRQWIEEIPVIMISAESSTKQVEQAYEMGATDFIIRPFDALIVHRRVVNTVLLYTKQKKLMGLVAAQIEEKERRSNIMVDILSHLVEFRNGESSLHIIHVRTLTKILLQRLCRKTERYWLRQEDISIIITASALHDIGKIAIDERILNKPGRLTKEEFEVMKTHARIGAEMLERLPAYQDEPLVRAAYEICRWHHERYDGRGYPDGLMGDDIPISAQVVALADVYDALTSDRCYKKAIPHKKAIQMILDGECGVFNPLLLECLKDVEGILENELASVLSQSSQTVGGNLMKEMMQHEKIVASERSLHLLYQERMKYNSFSALTEEIQFEYTIATDMLNLSVWGAEKLGLNQDIMCPEQDENVMRVLGEHVWQDIVAKIVEATPDQPIISYDCPFHFDRQSRWYRILIQTIWTADAEPKCTSVIGKALDIHDFRLKMEELEKKASHDTLTGLLNHASARELILQRMQQPDGKFALVIFDLDEFKTVNDTYGHIVGNRILQYVAENLRNNIRNGEIIARIGGDEYLIFLEYEKNIEMEIRHLFNALKGTYEGISVRISMGIALTDTLGNGYDTLFHAADQALYFAKRAGRGHYAFYDDTMCETLSKNSHNKMSI